MNETVEKQYHLTGKATDHGIITGPTPLEALYRYTKAFDCTITREKVAQFFDLYELQELEVEERT